MGSVRSRKKEETRFFKGRILTIEEGLCIQMMHIGSFDEEARSILLMDQFLQENGYENDINKTRLHHEIYLSDARKTEPSKMRTVIRHPIRKR